MRHRDRVAMALAREEPDRCPMQVGFTPEFAQRLSTDMGIRGLLNVAREGEHNPHGAGNTYELERAIGEDILLTSVGWANSYYQAHGTYTDEWGVAWQEQAYDTRFGTGHYTEMVGHPLADDAAIASYVPPDPESARALRRCRASHPRVRRRVLDRRGHCDDHLGDGLGPPWIRAVADGPDRGP